MPVEFDKCCGCQPTSGLCKACCPVMAVFAWEGCDRNTIVLAVLIEWLAFPVIYGFVFPFALLGPTCLVLVVASLVFVRYFIFLLFWQPNESQKRFRSVTEELECCCSSCCRYHPLDRCCHCLFPLCAVYAWQGCSNAVDILIVILMEFFCCGCCYTLFCWKPAEEQFVWDVTHLIGAPLAAATITSHHDAASAREAIARESGEAEQFGLNEGYEQATISSGFRSSDGSSAPGNKTYYYNDANLDGFEDEEEEVHIVHRNAFAHKTKGCSSSNKGKVEPADFFEDNEEGHDEYERFFKD